MSEPAAKAWSVGILRRMAGRVGLALASPGNGARVRHWAPHLPASGNRAGDHREEILPPLPAFLARAHEEQRTRQALARLGYRRVLAIYGWQRRNAIEHKTFCGLAREGLAPSLEFVGEWLTLEKKRIRSQLRATFFAATGITFVAGCAFAFSVILFK
jgi:hypothetical protein